MVALGPSFNPPERRITIRLPTPLHPVRCLRQVTGNRPHGLGVTLAGLQPSIQPTHVTLAVAMTVANHHVRRLHERPLQVTVHVPTQRTVPRLAAAGVHSRRRPRVAGQPLGVISANGTIPVAKESGQDADTVEYKNIVNMYARLHAQWRNGAKWFVSQDVEPQLHQMALIVGTSGIPVYMPANGVSGLPYGTLYGLPVIPVEWCQTLGDKGDIVLMNPKSYLVCIQGGIRSDMSIHLKFDSNQTAFRFITKIDGQPKYQSALTPKNGGNTISPIVTLAERA